MREARPFLKQKRVEAESADSDKLENLKNFSFLLDYPVPSIEKTNKAMNVNPKVFIYP
ncbi:hypothetical protein DSCO28_13620 [Desulfosarcina ovata subsp. sediminis]|uniref:Uncharacterized protein n=1 Tax=Desulfosarcina ovata subsp. sediminis TaxID=885957 RepID=A0A5K7ZIF8_9BACT|nr:hypothetical protein DSCO28_13620 [Desulfosarcina ovata subsp. sediminis]